MRISIRAILGLLLTCAASAVAQDVLPPPGFSPGDETESEPRYPPLPMPKPLPRSVPAPRRYSPRPDIIYNDPPPLHPYEVPELPAYSSTVLLPFPTVWFQAEALAWWTKASPVSVPLITTGGPIGSGSTVVLGNEDLNMSMRGGGRFLVGAAISSDHRWAVEGSYFFLGRASKSDSVIADGSPASTPLAFPFFNATTGSEDYTPVNLPGQFAGRAEVSANTWLQGLDANVLHNVSAAGSVQYDLLGGFRWVNVQENLTFTTDSPNVFPNPPAFFHTYDSFDTNNNFYGAQLGGRATFNNGRLLFNATGKVAIGDMVERTSISGATLTNVGGGYFWGPGSYLSQPTNIGSRSINRFAVIPEVNLNMGIQLTPWARFLMGYSFLYVSSVARPGDQIDRVINPTQAPAITGNPAALVGPARPSASIHDSSFWAQGLNFGLEFHF